MLTINSRSNNYVTYVAPRWMSIEDFFTSDMAPCYTRAISERFRDKGLIIECYTNSSVYFTLLTSGHVMFKWLLNAHH